MLAISANACEVRVSSPRRPSGRTGIPSLVTRFPDDGEQVGVARPFAVAVRGALDVRRARLYRGHRVGDRAARVVLAVDAEPEAGARGHLRHDLGQAQRQHAAVGVAQHRDVGARGDRGVQHAQRGVAGRTRSRRRSARRPGTPGGPRRAGSATVSATIAQFSATSVRSARSMCRRSDFATSVTTGAWLSSNARDLGIGRGRRARLAGGAERDQRSVLAAPAPPPRRGRRTRCPSGAPLASRPR